MSGGVSAHSASAAAVTAAAVPLTLLVSCMKEKEEVAKGVGDG